MVTSPQQFPMNDKLLKPITMRGSMLKIVLYPTVLYHTCIFHFYDVFVVIIYIPTKWPPNFEPSTGFSSENPTRTPREPQENPKRTSRELQKKKISQPYFNMRTLATKIFVPWEPYKNPKRTPWEPQENPKRTACVVQPSNFKEELEKNKTKAQVTGVLFGSLKLSYS